MANSHDSSGTGQVLSSITIPAGYWEPFRAGAIADLALDAGDTTKRFKKGYTQRMQGYPEDQRGAVSLKGEEHTGPLRYLAQTAALLVAMEEACPAGELPERAIEVNGHPEAIIFALQILASRFAGPMISEGLFSDQLAQDSVGPWMEIAQWAMEEVPRLEPDRLEDTKRRVEAAKAEAKS
jgi:hypothetical protein